MSLLLYLVIALFLAMLFVNVYFRVKVFKSYKTLVENRVEFNALDVFKKEKMAEVCRRYPEMEEEITTFVNHMSYSIKMASVLIGLITLFGAILMWYRE